MDLCDVLPGVQCWMHYKLGWPPIYATIAEMPAEEGVIVLHLLQQDKPSQATGTFEELDQRTADMMERFSPEH